MATRGGSGVTPPRTLWLLAVMLLATASFPDPLLVAAGAVSEGGGGGGGGGSREQSRALYIVVLNNLPPVADFGSDPSPLFSSSDPRVRTVAASLSSSSTSRYIRSRGWATGGRSNAATARSSFLRSQTMRTYAAQLRQAQVSTLTSAGIEESNFVTSYKYLVNAFAAKISPEEVQRLQSQPGVAFVQRSRIYTTQMNRTPSFLQLPSSLWKSAGGVDSAGENVIVGIVDSGILPEHPSFSDKTAKPYGPVPSMWRGSCQDTEDFPRSLCNRKLIGATYFALAALSEGFFDPSAEYLSPRDSFSHGTIVASIAAGNNGVNASVGGKKVVQISGIAPRARLAVYKSCWLNATQQNTVCSNVDILSALDRAWQDGVDVINLSLGSVDYHDNFDALDMAVFKASLSGMVITFAAGNSGESPPFKPYPQLDHVSPWYMTVAASTIDRDFTVVATLGNGVRIAGGGATPGNADTISRPLVLAAKCALNPVSNTSREQASLCLEGSLNATLCRGSIVVCTRGVIARVDKAKVVASVGGVGIILVNSQAQVNQTDKLDDLFVIPGMLITYKEGLQIEAYIRQTRRPVATIESVVPKAPPAPAVGSFSSRGPAVDPSLLEVGEFGPSPHILKPDLLAPGVGILAQDFLPPKGTQPDLSKISSVSGTSVSAPIVAGLAALLKQQWPTWSPSMIKSAMMTTASIVNDQRQPIKLQGSSAVATPFAMGAGHVNPLKMLRPGLVYDTSGDQYFQFLNGINEQAVRAIFKNILLYPNTSLPGYNLNQPYICVGLLRGSVLVTRNVTNVGLSATYTAQVVAPQGVEVAVSPSQLFLPAGASVTFAVRLTVQVNSTGFKFGSLTWVSKEGTAVRSVIAVQPLSVA